jgi:ATP-binding cassette subfamily B protein
MTRAIQDIALIQRLIAFGLIQVVIMIYAPLFGMSAMMVKSVTLTLLILPLLPLLYFYAQYVAKQMAESSRVVQETLSALGSHTQENLSGIRTVQAGAQEANEIARFFVTNDRYASAFYEQSRINSLMTAWTPWLTACAQLVILMYGGSLVLEGMLSVGDLIFFLACLNMLLQPIRMAGFFITMLARAGVAVDRLVEVFDSPPEIPDRPSGLAPASIRGHFELKGISYAYPGSSTPALNEITLEIRAGESIGIVGRVGAGKSTLLKHLVRLLDVQEGELKLDHHPIADYPLAQLRSDVVQVLQDPFLFGEPLKANISYDEPEREEVLIWDASEAAALKDTILGLADGLDTMVGERGVTLSGGQKQRATLARGLIRDAKALILDDCFSAVDTETEEHILTRLKALRGQRTTVLVSHRVSTLRHTDRIVVLDEGRIVESGTHAELLALGGHYAALERMQTSRRASEPQEVLA